MRPGRASLALATVVLAACAACSQEEAPHLRPDPFLRDSLGLTEADRVHELLVVQREGAERLVPAELPVRPGDRVAVRSGDGFTHRAVFDLDALAEDARAWLASTGQAEGPPLVSRDMRWVVDFSGAPPGRYALRVEGNRAEGRGVIVVEGDGG